jgi:hypothetical protein
MTFGSNLTIGVGMMLVGLWLLYFPKKAADYVFWTSLTITLGSLICAIVWGITTHQWSYTIPFLSFTLPFGLIFMQSITSKCSKTSERSGEAANWFRPALILSMLVLGFSNWSYTIDIYPAEVSNNLTTFIPTQAQVLAFPTMYAILFWMCIFTALLIALSIPKIEDIKGHVILAVGYVLFTVTGAWYIMIASLLYTSDGKTYNWMDATSHAILLFIGTMFVIMVVFRGLSRLLCCKKGGSWDALWETSHLVLPLIEKGTGRFVAE